MKDLFNAVRVENIVKELFNENNLKWDVEVNELPALAIEKAEKPFRFWPRVITMNFLSPKERLASYGIEIKFKGTPDSPSPESEFELFELYPTEEGRSDEILKNFIRIGLGKAYPDTLYGGQNDSA
ncbi:MAG: hypothetical protein M3X11_08845 [Acidobacteriota bacterium]|nr:hypothetical protein [Acidobacteriota bacterium]